MEFRYGAPRDDERVQLTALLRAGFPRTAAHQAQRVARAELARWRVVRDPTSHAVIATVELVPAHTALGGRFVRCWVVQSVCVAPPARGRGCARELLSRVVAEADVRRVPFLRLQTTIPHLYAPLGFTHAHTTWRVRADRSVLQSSSLGRDACELRDARADERALVARLQVELTRAREGALLPPREVRTRARKGRATWIATNAARTAEIRACGIAVTSLCERTLVLHALDARDERDAAATLRALVARTACDELALRASDLDPLLATLRDAGAVCSPHEDVLLRVATLDPDTRVRLERLRRPPLH